MVNEKQKTTTPLLNISILQPSPAVGGSILGPDILLAIVNAVNISTFCTLSYFGNDGLTYDQKMTNAGWRK